MATYYVKSGATGAANGASWADAFTTLKVAMEAPRVAGDVFYVSHQHVETPAAAYAITSPGTPLNPQSVYCVNDGAEPPTTLATGASISTSAANALSLSNSTYFDGIIFSAGSGTSNCNIVTAANGSSSWNLMFRNCSLRLGGTGTNSRINLGGAFTSGFDGNIELINTTMQFAHTLHGVNLNNGRIFWKNTAPVLSGAVVPSVLLNGNAPTELSGLDLSQLTGTLIDLNIATGGRVYFRNCKFNASVTLKSNASRSVGGTEAFFENCDSGATNYRMTHWKYTGSIVTETVVVKSSGATDGTTPISWKMVTLATSKLNSPLASPPITMWNSLTGSPLTVSVDVLHNSLTALKDNEIWLEVEYLAASTDPRSAVASDRVADIFTTAVDQDSSIATWTTTGIANPNKQKLSVTITPQTKGIIRAHVMCAKPSYTVYVDPVIQIGG